MVSRTPAPFFGTPPTEYSQRYMNDLVRAFAQFVELERNPGEGRFTFAVFTDLQDNDLGLEAGSLYQQDGVIKVSRANVANPLGSALIANVEDVTGVIT